MIDCAMTDGSAALSAMTWGFYGMGRWRDEPGVNLLDGAAHFYDTYTCSDGRFISVGSIEPQFYALLREKTGLAADPDFDVQMDPSRWPALKAKLTALFASQPRDHWCALMEATDVCFAPVLSLAEAPQHPHNVARRTFIDVGGVTQPAPAPRYSGTVAEQPKAPPPAGSDGAELLSALGYDADRLAGLKDAGMVG